MRPSCLVLLTLLGGATAGAEAVHGAWSNDLNLLDFTAGGKKVQRTGGTDISAALTAAVNAANGMTYFASGHAPQPACIHIPRGVYTVTQAPPMFKGAGCIVGDGSAQTIIDLAPGFSGDLFSWAEAWIVYGTSGATVRGLRINGAPNARSQQNALMFYDRNDNVDLTDLYIDHLPGRALGIGLLRPSNSAGQAYIRESHFLSLRIFGSGRPGVPAVEITSEGSGQLDGTNEISASQIDIFGSRGVSLAIHNHSSGVVRDIKFDSLRIEGSDAVGPDAVTTAGDLLQIGDSTSKGRIGHLSFTNLELLDPPRGYAAIRVASNAFPGEGPSRIYFQGYIGGGLSNGEGLRVDNGSKIHAVFDQILTIGTNVVIGPRVTNIVLDGGGAELEWTFFVDPASAGTVTTPTRSTAFVH